MYRKSAPSFILRDPKVFSLCSGAARYIREIHVEKRRCCSIFRIACSLLISWPASNIGLRNFIGGHPAIGALEQFGQRLIELSNRRDEVVLVFSEDKILRLAGQ